MRVVAIIPARLASTRFPNKPMGTIHGMPMIGHCYHRACIAFGFDYSYVATCDQQIFDYVEGVGGKAVMTSDKHDRAATRTAEALMHIESLTGEVVDLVVMIQGDEPMVLPESLMGLVEKFNDQSVEIVNLMSPIETLAKFLDKNNVKVVVNNQSDALYFSREPIPSPWKGADMLQMYQQTGIIGFRRDALIRFNEMPETRLERIESIDMNRVLEHGGKIRMVLMNLSTIGVDTQEEMKEVEFLMINDKIMYSYL